MKGRGQTGVRSRFSIRAIDQPPSFVENRDLTPDLRTQFGDIDIYLFDQLLRGRIRTGMRIFDAGCGEGRNLVYLLRAGYDVSGVDADAASIASVRRMAARFAPHLPADNFRVGGSRDNDVS